LRPGFQPRGKSWYRENSREQVRDETIRQGLITNNAVIERLGLATTSAKPRYALRADFAALFDPALSASDLQKAAETWREQHLSAAALARTVLLRRGAATTGEGILVTFPNGETRRMAPGPSSVISKAVIEEFAKRFLRAPAVLWVSESGAKVVARDDELAAQINLKIFADRNLPDIILVDLGDDNTGGVLLVFIEVVATDGPLTKQRQEALLKIATVAGFPPQRVAFVTAFLDRSHAAFKKTMAELAWNSFVWFAAEPQNLMVLLEGKEKIANSLAALM
jgi:BsuBI/PstI restriction endonuclease domain/BsuBI/PstI restriction endonuclease HTH domain